MVNVLADSKKYHDRENTINIESNHDIYILYLLHYIFLGEFSQIQLNSKRLDHDQTFLYNFEINILMKLTTIISRQSFV